MSTLISTARFDTAPGVGELLVCIEDADGCVHKLLQTLLARGDRTLALQPNQHRCQRGTT